MKPKFGVIWRDVRQMKPELGRQTESNLATIRFGIQSSPLEIQCLVTWDPILQIYNMYKVSNNKHMFVHSVAHVFIRWWLETVKARSMQTIPLVPSTEVSFEGNENTN